LKKLSFRLSLFLLSLFLFFPSVFLRAADNAAALPFTSGLRAELVRLLREEGFDIEELSPPEYEGKRASLLAALPVTETGTGTAQTEAPPSPDIFILGVPLSDVADERRARFERTSGEFPFGVKTALAFLKALREYQSTEIQPGKRVAVAFLEDAGEGGEFRGLEDLASSLDYPENAALVYLDFASPPGQIVIHHGVQGGIARLSLVRPLPGILEKWGVSHVFGVRSHELYNLGLAAGPAALERAHSLEIPAILLTASDVPGAVDPDVLAKALAEYAAAVQWETGGIDTHYSLFAYGKRIFFLSEGMTLVLILFLAGIGIVLWLRRSVPHRHNRHLSVTNAELPRQSGQKPPAGGPQWADHCAHIAVFLAILGILGGTFLDLSCAPAFIWALAFTILGAALPFVPAVFICALLSPFKGAETIFQTLREGAFISAPVPLYLKIYLFPALLSLPFLFLVLRGIILIVEKKSGRIPHEELEKSGL
jgi:hypothetical protein